MGIALTGRLNSVVDAVTSLKHIIARLSDVCKSVCSLYKKLHLEYFMYLFH